MRLSRYLAHSGIASRRAAEDLIRAGRVTVGGDVVTDPARDVDETSQVAFDGAAVRPVAETVVIAVHKPKGVVSTARDTHGRPTVVDLVGARRRLYPVGRLDADTTGLILLTDDGELANRLTHPRYGVPKTYRAVVARAPVREEAIEHLRQGVELDDGRTRPAQAKRLAPDKIELTIREGRKRQVRRMLEEVGHPVKHLQRVRFGPLRLDVGEGQFRQLTKNEVAELRGGTAAPRVESRSGSGRGASGGSVRAVPPRPSPRAPSRRRPRRSSGS